MKIHPKRPFARGFTLIELMIAVAIIAILAMVAIPKFGEMVMKAKESNAKNALGALRSALNVYYSDQTFFPSDLEIGLVAGQKYFKEIPTIDIPEIPSQGNPGHLHATGVKNVSAVDDDAAAGIFAYVTENDQGLVYINCTHFDAKGIGWSSY